VSIVTVELVREMTTEVDGRRLRREQNREAVLDALVELFEEGNLTPSSGEIAERAGLSPRSLFRYFDDVDDLNHAAIERQLEGARPLLEPGVAASAPLDERIDAIVEARLRLFETTAPAARAARACAHRHATVAAQVRDARRYLRSQLRRLFAAELGDGGLLPAVDGLCSFETYELLRRDQGLSRGATGAALVAGLTALLGARS
jgi:AcrR family transcriptional regulator